MVIWEGFRPQSQNTEVLLTPPRSGHPLQYEKGFLRRNFAKNILVSEMFVLQILYRRPLNSFKGIPNFLEKCLSITSRSTMIADSFGLRSRGTHCCQSSCLLLYHSNLRENNISEFELNFGEGKGKLVGVSEEFELYEFELTE